MTFRKIIFPVDYSDCSQAAVPFVKELVQLYDAALTLVHGYGSDVFPLNDMSLTYGDLIERVEATEQERLQTFADESFSGVTVKTTAQLADPSALVETLAQTEHADLIMLPTHGRGLFRRMLLGSVTAKLLHDLAIPVWTATPEALKTSGVPYRSVLCACDINDERDAAKVLQSAAEIACKYNANLCLLHIVELTPVTTEIEYASFRTALIDSANERLIALKQSLGIVAPHQVTEGPISTVIQREALERNIDLIVTGRGHQQGTVSRVWSNLYQIVRDAPCPVISI